MNQPAAQLDLLAPPAERQRAETMADTSLEAFEAILPTLQQREWEVFLLVSDYVSSTGYANVTGGELAAWSGKLITSLRPRITGLVDKGLLHSWGIRDSRAHLEGRCHPVSCAVPRSAIERARKQLYSEKERRRVNAVRRGLESHAEPTRQSRR